jgi:Flp pilus assembly protein TadB
MENELPPDHIKSLWQNQRVEPVQMSLEELRQKTEKFQRRIRKRNFREYAAAALVLGAFSYYFWKLPHVQLGSALIIAGTLYVVYQLHHRGAAKTVPASLGLGNCLDFHRGELERQRDLLRGIWKWYLLPLVPGLLAFVAVPTLHLPPRLWIRGLPFLLLCGAVFYAVWILNQRAAEKLQRQINELNSMTP